MSRGRRGRAPRLRLTDTTFRDANQSLVGGGIPGEELVRVAPKLDAVGFHSLEAFGGSTVETELSQHGENPWEYLRKLKAAAPKTPIQALIRGQNLVARRNFADDVVELFVRHAANCGVDIFRVFDPLNDVRNMEAAIRAIKKARRRVQGALCYAVSPVHKLETWCALAKVLQKLGCESIVIKDTSGLLSPQVAWELVGALKDVVKVPVAVHSHCSSGMAPMAYMAAVEAGAEIVDTALSPLAWGASQPAAESVVAALAGGDYDTGLELDRLMAASQELEAVKRTHLDQVDPLADRVEADILRYGVPGTMLQDVHRQLRQHRAEERLPEVLAEIARVRQEMGHPPLVAPVRQMIASQAVLNVTNGERYTTVTKELKDYLQGLYGRPPVPADTEIRRLVLGREEPITIRPADLLEPELPGARQQLKRLGIEPSDDNLLIYLLFPGFAERYFRGELRAKRQPEEDRKEPEGAGPETEAEQAVEAPAEAAASSSDGGPPQAAPAPAAAEFQVEVEGETFTVRVLGGGGVAVAPPATADAAAGPAAESRGEAAPQPAPAEAAGPGAVTAPMQGLIVRIPVKEGDEVKLGDTVAVLEAMKMQNDISAPVAGEVKAIHVKQGDVVGPNQPILTIG